MGILNIAQALGAARAEDGIPPCVLYQRLKVQLDGQFCVANMSRSVCLTLGPLAGPPVLFTAPYRQNQFLN